MIEVRTSGRRENDALYRKPVPCRLLLHAKEPQQALCKVRNSHCRSATMLQVGNEADTFAPAGIIFASLELRDFSTEVLSPPLKCTMGGPLASLAKQLASLASHKELRT